MPDFRGLAGLTDQVKRLYSEPGYLTISSAPDGLVSLLTLQMFSTIREINSSVHAMIILCESNKEIMKQQTMYSDSGYEVLKFPDLPLWGQDRYVNHRNLEHDRLQTLSHLSHSSKPCLIFTSLSALCRWCPDAKSFKEKVQVISSGEELEQEAFLLHLRTLGYQESHKPTEPGSFGLRGGILDLFNTGNEGPVRIEFFGDLISSLHRFNPDTGRSGQEIQEFALTPAYELLWETPDILSLWKQNLHLNLIKQKTPDWERHGMTESLGEGIRFSGFNLFTPLFQEPGQTLLSFLNQNAFFISLKPFQGLKEGCDLQLSEASARWQEDQLHQKPGMPPDLHYQSPHLTLEQLRLSFCTELGLTEDSGSKQILLWKGTHFKSPEPGKISDRLDAWLAIFREHLERQGRIFIFCASAYEREKIQGILTIKEFATHSVTTPKQCLKGISRLEFSGESLYLVIGHLDKPWFDPEGDHLFLPARIFGDAKSEKKPGSDKKKLRNFLNSFKDLKEGDLVVHSQHGIAKYAGLKKIAPGGTEGEFLQLRYHGGDHIYLPVDRINTIQKFHTGGDGGRSPAPDRLRSQAFQERKQKTAKLVEDIAEDLLRQDALRKIAKRKPCSPPDELYSQFVDDFPYEETDDQIRVIDEIDVDLSSQNPMDRIIVGDVGFGKTEVAMRSCMRMVLSGYQVMVLVPTTVLCYQHHKNFASRFEKYGVRVEALNRFIRAKNAKAILQDVNTGQVDVLVGTHRILSNDINPPKLRLIVIDEEHRFGVVHKERLKQLKSSADILTLTATPIPRTLHMAMIGLRDISLMTEPPPGRLPVRTMLSPPDDQLIKEAIQLEVSRGGQVFCLYNRVRDIQETCNRIRMLVPGVPVDYAHGQMHQNQLEKTLIDFIEQKFQVLVCTTIIESGIDMPNVNTMLIFDAENFGLAQLYQLRGRVGRSGIQAYTWLFSGLNTLSDEARKRLETLTAHQDPGSGFYIAGADLEMRGAGNLLGGEQTGHAHGVGYEMYSRMLENEIKRQRGETVEELPDPEIQSLQKAVITESYITDASERLRQYKKIFAAETESGLDDIFAGLRERFGKAPSEVLNLHDIANIKLLLKQLKIKKFTEKTPGNWEASFSALDELFLKNLSGMIWSGQIPSLKLNQDFSLRCQTQSLSELFQSLKQLAGSLSLSNAQNHNQS